MCLTETKPNFDRSFRTILLTQPKKCSVKVSQFTLIDHTKTKNHATTKPFILYNPISLIVVIKSETSAKMMPFLEMIQNLSIWQNKINIGPNSR